MIARDHVHAITSKGPNDELLPPAAFHVARLIPPAGCAHRPDLAAPPAACAAEVTAGTRVERIAIQVFPDQHGDTAVIDACPDLRFPLDWSKSPLFTPPYANLLKALRMSASTDQRPIGMIVSGRFERRAQDEVSRTYLIVTAIEGDVITR
jgi:hypothetical protein